MRRIAAALLGFALPPIFVFAFASAASTFLGRDRAEWALHDEAYDTTRALLVAVELYRRDHQHVPPPEIGLPILVPQYYRSIPTDPWGNALIYKSRGSEWADVVSLGSDGKPGGSGTGSDITGRYGSPGTSTPAYLVNALVFFNLTFSGLAFAGSRRSPLAGDALAGMALFWAFAVAASMAPNGHFSPLMLTTYAIAITTIATTVLYIRRFRRATIAVFVGAVACQATISVLLSTA